MADILDPAHRYEVLRRLDTGGAAEVLLADARGPGGFRRRVALKRLLPHLRDEPSVLASFLDEAQLLGALHHRNVVAALGLLDDDEGPTLVLEHLDGHTVDTLRRDGPLPAGLAAYVVAEAAAGLHAAHELKADDGSERAVVHRDVAPRNLFVTVNGDVKLLDFGIARAEGQVHQTRDGVVKGTLGYLAPERLQQAPYDRRADLFSLGVVLWELLTGTRLYGGRDPAATVAAICDRPPPAPSQLLPSIPPGLDEVTLRALAPAPRDRFETAAALREALLAEAAECYGLANPPADALGARLRTLVVSAGLDARSSTAGQTATPAPRTATLSGTASLPLRTRRWPVLAAALAAVGLVTWFAIPGSDTRAPVAEAAEVDEPVPPPAAPAAQPAPPGRAEETVALTVRSTPAGARAEAADTSCETPCVLSVARAEPVTVVVRHPRYRAEQRALTPDADAELSVTLRRRPRPAVRSSTAPERPPDDGRSFYPFE